MAAAQRKLILLSDTETAKILGITQNKLYRICNFFDAHEDDAWDLNEGEHFEWVMKNVKKRRFYEAGAVAIAKYLQETETSGLISGLIDKVIEKFTHRRQKIRKHLVRRKVAIEFASLNEASIEKDLVFLARPKVIRILETNGKGLNASIRRIQNNNSLDGRAQLEPGEHLNYVDSVEHWSQRGIARIAEDMSANHGKKYKKARKAWTDTVFEEIEDAIAEQRKYLESFDSRVKKVMEAAKLVAQGKCQVSLVRQSPVQPFDLHAHHLFDRSSRPDLADVMDNLLVMHEDIHHGFHMWHGHTDCEPKDFIEYLLKAEDGRFDSQKKTSHFRDLVQKLEKIQQMFEDFYYMS